MLLSFLHTIADVCSLCTGRFLTNSLPNRMLMYVVVNRRRTMDVCLYSTVKMLTNLDRLEYRVRVRTYAVRLHATTSIEQRPIDGCYDDDRVQCSTHYYEKKITFDDLYFFTSTKPNIPPFLSHTLSLCWLLGNGHSVLATNAGVYSCTPNTTKRKTDGHTKNQVFINSAEHRHSWVNGIEIQWSHGCGCGVYTDCTVYTA